MPTEPTSTRTVAIYDRPPWWRRRATLRLLLPIGAAIVSLGVLALVTYLS
jgi:hypothetical protein